MSTILCANQRKEKFVLARTPLQRLRSNGQAFKPVRAAFAKATAGRGVACAMGLQVYADLVFNHNSGADVQESNPIDGQLRWTKFTPKSGKFPRDWKCFHPSQYETWDGVTFGDMPDLCHRTPFVYTELITYARWLLEEIGFDGFRYDMVKGYGGWMVRSIQELRALRGGTSFKPYAVGECWDSERTIDDWLDEANAWSDNPVGAFDFPVECSDRELSNAPASDIIEIAVHFALTCCKGRFALQHIVEEIWIGVIGNNVGHDLHLLLLGGSRAANLLLNFRYHAIGYGVLHCDVEAERLPVLTL